MNFLSNYSIIISLVVILLLGITGFWIVMSRIRKCAVDTPNPYDSRKKIASSSIGRSILLIALFSLIILVALVLLVNFLSVPPIAPEPTDATATPTPIMATPSAIPVAPASTSANQFLRFDELDTIIPLPGNLSVNGWGDDSSFKIDDRTYSYGIGLIFSGTDAEKKVQNPEDTPDQIIRGDCKEFTAEYALREHYSGLVFSIGADNGDPQYYGDENAHGIAEVLMTDKETGSVLFDTGWVNYTYAIYEATVDLSNVDVLAITYRTCGVSNLNKLKNGLRFAIVDPMLFLKDDAE